MSETPAGAIRGYLDEHGGHTEVPFHNLLSTWELREGDLAERAQMTDELAAEGVVTEPPLTELGPDSRVILRLTHATPGQGREERYMSARGWRASIAIFLAIAALGALAGFLLGRSSGEDLDAARAAGELQGEREGTALGGRRGYRAGYARGERRGYERSYRRAYRRAFEESRERGPVVVPSP